MNGNLSSLSLFPSSISHDRVISDTEGRDLAKHFGCALLRPRPNNESMVMKLFPIWSARSANTQGYDYALFILFVLLGLVPSYVEPSGLTLPFRILRNNKLASRSIEWS